MNEFKKSIFRLSNDISFKWLPSGVTCEKDGFADNTGYQEFSTLLKVTNDMTNRPLDINNDLCSDSGLPQDSKSNTIGQPDYIDPMYNIVACPLGRSYSYKRDGSQIEEDPSFHIPYVEYTDTNNNPAVFYPDQFTDACGSFFAVSIDRVVYCEVCP